MNPLIRLIAVLAIGGAGTWYGFSSYHKLKREDANRLALQQLEKDWLERANWVNDTPDADKYREERGAIDKWYFTELTDHYNHFPEFRDYYRGDPEHASVAGKRKAKKDDLDLRKQYYGLVKNVFDALKDGTYSPQLTGTSNSLRLDLVKIAKRADGQKGFRIDAVLWGAQRRLDKETQPTGETLEKMITAASFSGMDIKLFDEKGKVAAEMPVSGDPEIKVDYPERWIEEFPPQAVIGYYNLPPLPANAVKMELTMSVTSHSISGSDILGSYKWELPVDADWKLAPGETWEGATTEERSKDYIEGKADN